MWAPHFNILESLSSTFSRGMNETLLTKKAVLRIKWDPKHEVFRKTENGTQTPS